MKKQIRLYNVLLPIWLLFLFPQILVFIIPANLMVDCAVLFICLLALKHTQKGAVVKKLWWKLWLLGFAADGVGVAWMLLGWYVPALSGQMDTPFGAFWEDAMMSAHMLNPWTHPLTLAWTLAGVAIAGVCIYFFDKKAMRKLDLLTGREKHTVALTMAIVTAPWLFLVPLRL